MKKKRFIWEEILEEPAIYRICEAGSRKNAYLIASGGESLVVDPRSEEMIRSIGRLSGGLDAPPEKMQIFLTQGCMDASMETMIQALSAETIVYAAISGELEGTGEMSRRFRSAVVSDGNKIRIGSSFLQCIRLEGHARGLTGLWLSKEGILFSGDAVGRDYLPDVPAWDSRIDTLGLQIESLRRIGHLPVRLILPGQGMIVGLEEEEGTDSRRISNACALALENMIGQYCIHILEMYQQIPSKGSVSLEQLEKNEQEKALGNTGSEEEYRKGLQEEEYRKGLQEEEYRKDPQEEEYPDNPGKDPDPGDLAVSCRKYLLYRKYIRQKEDEKGNVAFERGSMLLSDWSFQEEQV